MLNASRYFFCVSFPFLMDAQTRVFFQSIFGIPLPSVNGSLKMWCYFGIRRNQSCRFMLMLHMNLHGWRFRCWSIWPLQLGRLCIRPTLRALGKLKICYDFRNTCFKNFLRLILARAQRWLLLTLRVAADFPSADFAAILHDVMEIL